MKIQNLKFEVKNICALLIIQNLPRLRFNKEGSLLAVTTANDGFKILANSSGLRYMKMNENPPFEALRTPIEPSKVCYFYGDI